MGQLQQYITVQLQHDILTCFDAVQYDVGREFHFIIEDYEIPEDITDLRIYIQKPSGLAIYNFCTLSNNEIIYQPTPQTLSEVGICVGELQIIKNSGILSSFPFKINVSENLVDNGNFSSGKEFTIFDELIKTAQQCEKELKQTNDLINEEETKRADAEKIRVNNEKDRVDAEAARNLKMTEWGNAEEARVESEKTRVENEGKRNDSEEKRKEAEQEREKEISNIKTTYNNSLSEINTAIKKVNSLLDGIINDDQALEDRTYSSKKIEEVVKNQFIFNELEPDSQSSGQVWLKIISTQNSDTNKNISSNGQE